MESINGIMLKKIFCDLISQFKVKVKTESEKRI